ncbi:DUF6907 domain-containing protein [Streptomyces sp. NPDC002853]
MATTVQPAVLAEVAEIPAPRLSPALIKGARIYVECPEWCTVDHVAENENHVEDVWHGGEYADLNVPRMNSKPDLLAFARIGIDPLAADPDMREAFVMVDDGGTDFYMKPEQAEEFADNLDAFAARIRDMARTARGTAS